MIGVDPAAVMLRVARTRWRRRPDVAWRAGTAESLPVEDGWASVIWSLATVHHWADVDAGLREIGRVLAPGGRLVVVERLIGGPTATIVSGHGWTRPQADAFATRCTSTGFVDVAVGEHPGRAALLSVVAHRTSRQASASGSSD